LSFAFSRQSATSKLVSTCQSVSAFLWLYFDTGEAKTSTNLLGPKIMGNREHSFAQRVEGMSDFGDFLTINDAL